VPRRACQITHIIHHTHTHTHTHIRAHTLKTHEATYTLLCLSCIVQLFRGGLELHVQHLLLRPCSGSGFHHRLSFRQRQLPLRRLALHQRIKLVPQPSRHGLCRGGSTGRLGSRSTPGGRVGLGSLQSRLQRLQLELGGAQLPLQRRDVRLQTVALGRRGGQVLGCVLFTPAQLVALGTETVDLVATHGQLSCDALLALTLRGQLRGGFVDTRLGVGQSSSQTDVDSRKATTIEMEP